MILKNWHFGCKSVVDKSNRDDAGDGADSIVALLEESQKRVFAK